MCTLLISSQQTAFTRQTFASAGDPGQTDHRRSAKHQCLCVCCRFPYVAMAPGGGGIWSHTLDFVNVTLNTFITHLSDAGAT